MTTTTPGRTVNISATDKQRLAWIVWDDPITDDLIYGGAAGGGKSMLAGMVLTGTALKYPGTKQFLGRNELKRLMQTSYITLTQKVFPLYGLKQDTDWKLDGKYNVIHFKNPKTKDWDGGSTIDLLDLAYTPADPLYERFGSLEYTRGWIEEASEVNFKAYDVLKSRIGRWMNQERGIKSKLGLSLNPSQDWPYRLFYKVWKDAGRPRDINKPLISVKTFVEGQEVVRTFVFIEALYKDNPFTAGEYAKNLATINDPVLKARLMEADWEYASANDTLFDAATIADLFTNPVPPSDEHFMTVDVARFGGDEIVLTKWRGWDAFKIDRYTMKSAPETAELVRIDIDRYGIPRQNVLLDEDGIGGPVMDLVPGVIGFSGGAPPFGKIGEKEVRENFDNLRAQSIYYLAQMARERKARVSEMNLDTRERIAEDLRQMKRRDAEKDGKLKVAKKEDMRAALGRSPDCGDTLMMRSYFDLRTKEQEFQEVGEISVYIPADLL